MRGSHLEPRHLKVPIELPLVGEVADFRFLRTNALIFSQISRNVFLSAGIDLLSVNDIMTPDLYFFLRTQDSLNLSGNLQSTCIFLMF